MVQIYPGTHAVPYENIDLTGGFWYEKQKLVREVSMRNVYRRFAQTGRFDAFRYQWREGMPNRPHIYWDSDVAKWMEAAAYYCKKQRDAELEAIIDDIVEEIAKNRSEDGYFNSYFGHLEPENRFTRRNDHELYCAGHLLEAAIAYRDATGKGKFLSLMIDYIDLIYRVFYVEKSAPFTSPGHEEIELALVKLYRATGERKYLDLALYFVEQRGTPVKEDVPGMIHGIAIQDHLPIREQKTAEGHAVRACYLYSAVADLALETGDETLFDTAKTLFDNIVRRRMYVTGAIGQTCVGEMFMGDYDLPNQSAYAETCANLSLALFARRMSVLDPDAVYADTAERVLFNSFLSGMSLDGRAFFYSNMQENDRTVKTRSYNSRHTLFTPDDTRVEVFQCSCCPPNVIRTIASIADFQYTTDEDTIWMHQYFASAAHIGNKTVTVETAYPYDGCVKILYHGSAGKLALRIPGWCREYSLSIGGKMVTPQVKRGYAYLSVTGGDEILFRMEMPVRFVEAHPLVWDDAGRVAVTRGPLVYCMEGCDNAYPLRDIRLSESSDWRMVMDEALGVPVLETDGCVRHWNDNYLYGDCAALEICRVKMIPYFAFANRGSSDMVIWVLKL